MHIAIVAVIILVAIVLVVVDHKRLKQATTSVAADATNAIASVDHGVVVVAEDAAKEVEKV
jgi:hypothetical protein